MSATLGQGMAWGGDPGAIQHTVAAASAHGSERNAMTVRCTPSGVRASPSGVRAFGARRSCRVARRDFVEGLGRCSILDIRRRATNQAQVHECGTSATIEEPDTMTTNPFKVWTRWSSPKTGAVAWTSECAW